MTDPIDIDAIQRRADAATAGPWEHYYDEDAGLTCVESLPLRTSCKYLPAQILTTDADAVFVAAARTDVPALVARVRADAERVAVLEAERDDARKDAVEWSDATDDLREALAQLGRDVDALEAERDAAFARIRALDDACLTLQRAVDHAEETALRDAAAWAEQRERVAALEAIIAGRTTAPTLAEVRAHEARGGDWLYQDPDSDIPDGALSPEVWYILATPDDELFARHVGHCDAKCGRVYEQLPAGRWWPWSDGLVAWPVTP